MYSCASYPLRSYTYRIIPIASYSLRSYICCISISIASHPSHHISRIVFVYLFLYLLHSHISRVTSMACEHLLHPVDCISYIHLIALHPFDGITSIWLHYIHLIALHPFDSITSIWSHLLQASLTFSWLHLLQASLTSIWLHLLQASLTFSWLKAIESNRM